MNKDLWTLIQEGNEQAFSHLYNEYADMLFSYGMKVVCDEDTVTEAIQNLFIYLFEKRGNLSRPESVKAYLYVALKRLLIRSIQKQRTFSILSLEHVNVSEYDFELEIDMETALMQGEYEEELLRTMQGSLDDLSPQQREVIYLKYYKSCSNDEIAEVLGVNNQVVRNVASRALSKLREIWSRRKMICFNL